MHWGSGSNDISAPVVRVIPSTWVSLAPSFALEANKLLLTLQNPPGHPLEFS